VAEAAAGSHRLRKDIEGLRAISDVSVVLYNSGVPRMGGGFVGVDVFFVISGFLITGQLIRDDGLSPRQRIGRFYARRLRRIVPAATFAIVATLVGAAILQSPLLRADTRDDAVSAMFFFSNIRFASAATDYFRQTNAPSLFQHFWSLSVEEQFYFLWPALLIVVSVVAARRHRAATAITIGVVAAFSFAACVRLTDTNPSYAFFLLPARAWELSIGAGLALVAPQVARLRLPTRLVRAVGLGLVITAITQYSDATHWPGTAALMPVLGTAIVIAAGMSGDEGHTLTPWVMQALGRYSYSIYLWHWPVLLLANLAKSGVLSHWPQAVAVMVLVALPLAIVSYHVVENPLRRSLTRRADRDSILTGIALIAASAVALIPFEVAVDVRLDAGRAAPVAAKLSPAVATDFVPSNLEPSLRRAHDFHGARRGTCYGHYDCASGDLKSATVIVLYGDSHAGHWGAAFSAMAEHNGWRLEVISRGGCASYDHPAPRRELHCERFRVSAQKRIAELHPALVVFSNQSVTFFGADRAGWEAGITSAIERLPAGTATAVLAETPVARAPVPACLALHLNHTSACEPKQPNVARMAFNRALMRVFARSGGAFIDVNQWICDRDRCPVIQGNVLVYRDPNHITGQFASAHADDMRDLVMPLLPK
jgi:peptidoglycan/LPS O-acetylase OafA/YrhL